MMVDEWLGNLRSLRDLKRSTIRSYSEAVRAFCHFITDPLYEWTATREERFGTHPVQVVHEWNTAVHVQDDEADAKKRAFTKAELHAFFAPCDEVARIRAFGRKGWLPAFRDATLFKTAYAYGTRRNETRMLDAADFGRNPHGGEFGRCQVRFGKAKKGSPPKRRGVLTVFDWTPDRLLPMRSPQAQGRHLAGRIRLPDLFGPSCPDTGDLPGMRRGPGPSWAPSW